MPKWIPEQIWDNQSVFIIGGGKSLEHFDWSLLHKELTIGCNDAYKLGTDICKICIFGDSKWFMRHERELALYKGVVFTNVPKLQKSRLDWLWLLGREATGIHKESLGWNFNTGAAAINLALLLGANTIFLLGFDMQLSKDGKANWHPNLLDKPNPDVFKKFLNGFENVERDLKEKYPDVEVFNITDNSSLNLFPKIGVEEFWKGRSM